MTRNYKPGDHEAIATTTSSRAWLEEHAEAIRANLARHGASDLADVLGVGEVPC